MGVAFVLIPPKTYRLYCFDVARKAVSADFLHASSDEEAMAHAQANCAALKCEIWDGERLVGRLDDKRSTSPSGSPSHQDY